MIRIINCRPLASLTTLLAAFVLVTLAASHIHQASANVFGVAEPLSAEKAFIPGIADIDDREIAIEFVIAEGYYLYKDKLDFSIDKLKSVTANSSGKSDTFDDLYNAQSLLDLADPAFSESLIISDDFFGEQAIFRQSARITLPYTLQSPLAHQATLAIKYQGCADIGLCYPPTTANLTLNLPAGRAAPQSTTSSVAQAAPNSITASQNPSLNDVLKLDKGGDELLPPELAYLPQIISASDSVVKVGWIIEEGYYLYRDKLSFALKHPAEPQIVNTILSEGTEQFDEFFGNVSVLRHAADASIQFTTKSPPDDTQLAGSQGELVISYQGCADIGVCFPPSETTLPVNFMANAGTTTATLNATINPEAPLQSEQDRLSDLLGNSSLWITAATFFGLGLLLAFTPCVLPMIPILSSLIVGQGQSMNTMRAFQLSLVYVLVMATTYAAVGVAVGLSGYNIQAFLQHPYVLLGIAVLFVILSLSMFGLYELQMPSSVQGKLTDWSNKQGGGQVGSVAAMGFISTLIVGPCVTAPLAGALIYIAKTGDALIGGAALFALGLGMGAPLLLIGTSAGRLVPKAGAWMDATKTIFGILMLAMAVYMISRFLPTTVVMALYGILAVMSGVYLGATDSMSRQSSGWQRFGKGAGLVVAIYGVALLIGALAGGNSYTTPLRSLTASTSNSDSGVLSNSGHALDFQRVKSVSSLEAVVASASTQGRPVMLDFYADWCISCKEMEAFTFSDETVQDLLKSAIVVQADVTANDEQDQALLKRFNLFGPPGIIFYDANGIELPAARVVGFMNAEKFSAHIRRFLYNSDT